jgi:cbb3-type cytochrome oxidase subunit 1
MQHKESLIKTITAIFIITVVFWIGGSLIRNIIAFDLFIPATELSLKNYYSNEIRLHTIHLYSVGSVYTGTAFGIALAASCMLFVLLFKRLKQEGWLFMSFVLFFIISIVELYTMYLDIMLGLAIKNSEIYSFSSDPIKNYFLFRYYKLGILEPMKYLGIITIIILAVWKPLSQKSINHVKQSDDTQ